MSNRSKPNGEDRLDLPYERVATPEEPADMGDQTVFVTGGIVVASMGPVEMNDGTKFAAIRLQFPLPDGDGFTVPVVVAMSAENMKKLRPLVAAAVHDACESLKKAEE